jgi:4-hydroxy-3-methylbut-2-enyl diphosphate reductase
MKAVIEPGSGFCFGVENAVSLAEESLRAGEKVYCLGEIVHNETEMARLKRLGLVTINYDQFLTMKDCKVMVRAHGEPPSTYETALKNNITVIDATCPIVHTLQQRIKRAAGHARNENGQVVIYGKEGHAEVVGLMGAAGGDAVLVSSVNDIPKIDFTGPVYLFSQTTMSKTDYARLADIISIEVEKAHSSFPSAVLRVSNSICGQVSGREPRLRKFSKEHDVIIFVSGQTSSNGRMLFEVCLSENKRTHFISSVTEIDPVWFRNAESAGICGATSTPRWLIHEVAAAVEKL